MKDAILVINAGSSSLKFAGYIDIGETEPEPLGKGLVEGIDASAYFTVKNEEGNLMGEYCQKAGHRRKRAWSTDPQRNPPFNSNDCSSSASGRVPVGLKAAIGLKWRSSRKKFRPGRQNSAHFRRD